MKNKIKIIISWIVVALIVIAIFVLSSQDSKKSASVSDGFINNTIGSVNNGELLENLENKYTYDVLSGFIRNLGHLFEYAVLGFFTYNAIYLSVKNRKLIKFIFSIIFVVIIASLDELYQGLSDRVASFKDVGIDTIGGICGIIGMMFCFFVIKLFKQEFFKNNKIKLVINK